MSRQGATGRRLHLFLHPLHARRSVLATGQFRDEHRLERVHGTADVPVAHLLEEDQTEAVASFAVLTSRREGVELRLYGMLLRSEFKSCWQGEHANAMAVEGIVGHVLRVVGQRFALVRPIQRRAVQVVACGRGKSTG